RHIEQHTDISDIIVCNVYSWELIRASVIESLMEFTGKWEKHFQTSPKIDYRFDHEGKRSMDDVFSEETFIMEFPRKNGIDKKTAAFQNIPNSIVMEYPQTNGYSMRSHSLKSNVVAAKHFLEKNKIKVDIKFKKHDLANIKKMNRIIYEHLGININIEAFLKPRL
ncbi:TPA: glycosyl hydrolase family 1, partial [Neisseria meningitidis]